MGLESGNFVPGVFTPVLAKHTKSFNLGRYTLGWSRPDSAKLRTAAAPGGDLEADPDHRCTAKLILYSAFVDGKLEAPRSLLPEVHRLYFEPEYPEFSARTIWSLSNAFTSAFKKLDPIPQFKATAMRSP